MIFVIIDVTIVIILACLAIKYFLTEKKRVLEIDAQFYFWKDGIGILFALRPVARTESYASFFLWLPKIFSTFLTALC